MKLNCYNINIDTACKIIYCDMITWSTARQQLGKHVSATTDTHAIIKDILGNGICCAVHPED
jgi:hypothetical protein